MNIALIDADGHNFPNLPLMKLSAWHKAYGDSVEWYTPLFSKAERVYMSKVFTFTDEPETPPGVEVIKGGTGYSLSSELPNTVESAYPDYGLYGIKNTAYGFLTRGCPRRCPFCIVSRKEGTETRQVADVGQFWRGQKKIVLLDPNLLAAPNRVELLRSLQATGARIDFTQGLDIRLVDDEIASIIKTMKIERLHFSWDNINDISIESKLSWFQKKTGLQRWKVTVYVLCNFNSSINADLQRIYTIRDIGFNPYVMVYNKHRLDKNSVYRRLQSYVNNKIIFNSINSFEEYRTQRILEGV
jgi:hypothetical protein